MLQVDKFAGITATYAGGGTSTTFTIPGLLTTDIVFALIRTSTNSVSVTKVIPSAANTLSVTFSADPGAGTTLNFLACNPKS